MVTTTETKKEAPLSVDVTHSGTQIVLPNINGKPMDYDMAIDWLARKKKEEQTKVSIRHSFSNCSPLDAAVAFSQALKETFGWAQQVATPPKGFFDDEKPPLMIGVPTGVDEITQVPLGRLNIPGVVGFLEASISVDPVPEFIIGGTVQKRYEKQIIEIAQLTRKILSERSIYKGKAVKVNFAWQRQLFAEYDPLVHAPKYMELTGTTETDLIFDQTVIDALSIGLFTPITHTNECRAVGVPLKRGILLYGPYGTGKTMTAFVTALKAIANGWTFIYLDDVRDLKKGLDMAAQYAPCILFAEDIDRVMKGGRSSGMDEILNTLDGVDTKGAEVITVFTTNHIDQINPATLRMGRLDSLIHVTPPDAEAAIRLVRLYGRQLISDNVDLTKVGQALAGKIPAFIREATERAKIATVARIGSADIGGHVTAEDVLNAANALEPHVQLLKPKEPVIDVSDFSVLVDGDTIQALARAGVN